MDAGPLLLADIWPETVRGFFEHYKIEFFVALIIVLVGFFRKRIIDLSGSLAAVKVHGVWDTTIQPDDYVHNEKTDEDRNHGTKEEPHETARLHQFFNKVWGETECKSDLHKSFKVRGQIVGEKLTLVYRATEGFYCGAILLNIRNTKLMEGYEIGRDRNTGEIYHKTYTWHRRDGRLG